VTRTFAWLVPNGGAIAAWQGKAISLVNAISEKGAEGALKHLAMAELDKRFGGMATHLVANDGNILKALGDKMKDYDPRSGCSKSGR
jgi:hypothetical protein